MEHARLACSSSGLTVKCAASVQMQEAYPELQETDDAREGEAQHYVCSDVLESYLPGSNSVKTCSEFIGKQHENGVIITEEMTDAANIYVTNVLKTAQQYGCLSTLQVEKRLQPAIHVDNWGTTDCTMFASSINTVFVIDNKYGHRYVDHFENWQGLNYAILATNGMPENTKIVIRIVQPRCFSADPIREWSLTVEELRPYRNRLEMAFNEALSENPSVNSGPHCVDCTAFVSCTYAQRSIETVLTFTGNMVQASNPLQNENLYGISEYIENAERVLKDFKESIAQQVWYRMSHGQYVPGFHTKEKVGRLTWDKPYDEVKLLGEIYGQDLTKKELKTPTQACKLIDETVINAYASRSNGGVEIVRDKRKAEKVFKQ